MGLIERIATNFLATGTVAGKKQIAEGTYHLQIQLDKPLKNYIPGQHLRVFLHDPEIQSLGDRVRTYSVWNYESEQQLVHIGACAHSTGSGARWVQNVETGAPFSFGGPKGKFTVDPSGDYYLFIGDTSALAHLYEIRRHLSPGQPVYGLVYGPSNDHFFRDLDGSSPFQFEVLPENPVGQIQSLIQPFLEEQTGKGIVYVGGDGRLCVALNRYFRQQLDWPAKQVKTKPFWMPGKKGLE